MEAALNFYFDEMMPHSVADQLTQAGIAVTLAVEVGMMGKDDLTEHLPYATQHNLVLVTLDRPFAGRASYVFDHGGLICWTGDSRDFGGMVCCLSAFAGQYTPETVRGQVFWFNS